MTFDNFIKLLPKIQKMPVPGAIAQYEMIPEIRVKELKRMDMSAVVPRHAAVTLLCYPKKTETYMVLIERPTYEGVHSGQVALPGGKVEVEDASYLDAALRETFEEVGVSISAAEVLRDMTKTYIPPSNFWVHPFLAYTTTPPVFVPQEDEVAAIIEVPLSDLLADENVFSEIMSTSYAKEVEVPAFRLNGYKVWGATAMMLNELKVFFKAIIQS